MGWASRAREQSGQQGAGNPDGFTRKSRYIGNKGIEKALSGIPRNAQPSQMTVSFSDRQYVMHRSGQLRRVRPTADNR